VRTRSRLAKSPACGKQRKVDFFYLNDGSFHEGEHPGTDRRFLQSYFPMPAPWERAAGDK
jgi:Stealth protein CR4, conserved region 4